MEQLEILETFTFCELEQKKEHSYRVTAHEQQYALERDGRFIAELNHGNGTWEQASGTPLSTKLINKIGDRIEAHYC